MDNTLGPAEVAKMMGVTAMTVRRISDKGELAFNVTPGGHRRYIKQDILNYCQAKGIKAQSLSDQPSKVLIVDDDEQVVTMLSAFIEPTYPNLLIEIAHGGFEAGLKVKTFEPDIIISDIRMPDLSGTKMCEMLKLNPDTKHIRIIGVSGTTDEDEVRAFLSAGAEVCLRKPVKRVDIVNALKISD